MKKILNMISSSHRILDAAARSEGRSSADIGDADVQ